MKYMIQLSSLIVAALVLLSACDTPEQRSTASLTSAKDSVSYSFGYLYGANLEADGLTDIDIRNFLAGFQTALEGEDSEIGEMDMQGVIQVYLQEAQAAMAERQAADAEENIQKGIEFMEENAEREDVSVTESGLQYRVIEEGTGAKPSAEDNVEVHYRGTLISGEEFDSSYSRGEPVSFPLNRVIAGWTEGVQLMNTGSTYEFFVPADLAYGNNPPPGSIIPPGAVLIFEVELIDIQ